MFEYIKTLDIYDVIRGSIICDPCHLFIRIDVDDNSNFFFLKNLLNKKYSLYCNIGDTSYYIGDVFFKEHLDVKNASQLFISELKDFLKYLRMKKSTEENLLNISLSSFEI